MKGYRPLCAALLLLGSVLQVQADSIHPQLDARHTIIVGAYWQDVDAEFYANVDAQQIPNSKIDLGDLGMSESDTSVMTEYRFRLNEKWLFSLGGYIFRTDGSIESKKTFDYDGVEFEAGVQLDSKLKLDTYIADVLYNVYSTEKSSIFIGGGFHVTNIKSEVKTKIFVDDRERTGMSGGDDLLAPLPNLRMQGMYAFSPKWALTGTVGWLSLNYDDYEGSFTYLHARLGYSITEHFGVSAGYQFLSMDYSVQRKRGEAGIDIEFSGPTLQLGYRF